MHKNSLQKRDKVEQYRNLLDIMKKQIRSLETVVQTQNNHIQRLENELDEMKHIVQTYIQTNKDYIDANYLESTHQKSCNDDDDDISVLSQDSMGSLNSIQSKRMKNELGGTVKQIYIQHQN